MASQKVTIENGTLVLRELDVKRFYMPGVVLKTKCPKCGADHTRNFRDEYLAYPQIGTPFQETLYCSACENEWTVALRLDITFSAPT